MGVRITAVPGNSDLINVFYAIAQSFDFINLESSDTSDWLTYENEEYGFSFRYPGDWTAKPGSVIVNWNPIVGITSSETQQIIDDAYARGGYCEGCGPDIQIYYYDSFSSLLGNNPNHYVATTIEELAEEQHTSEKLGIRMINGQEALEVKEGGFGIYYALYIQRESGEIFKIFVLNWDGKGYKLTDEEDMIIKTFTLK